MSNTQYIELEDSQIDKIIIHDLKMAYVVAYKPKLQKAIKRVLRAYMLKGEYEEWLMDMEEGH